MTVGTPMAVKSDKEALHIPTPPPTPTFEIDLTKSYFVCACIYVYMCVRVSVLSAVCYRIKQFYGFMV